jgi:hypothetical protein
MRTWAKTKYRNSYRKWLALPDYGEEESFALPLRPPREQAAGKDMDLVARWISQWRRMSWPSGCSAEIEWKTVTWRTLGTQKLPVRIRIQGASSMAAVAQTTTSWKHLVSAAEGLRRAWPQHELAEVLPRVAQVLEELKDDDLERLIDVVNWLVENPASGILPRQLPVPGIDSKWLERHRSIIEKLKAALTGSMGLGLAPSSVRFGVRVLDDSVAGVRDETPRSFSAPISELARLTWSPAWVLIVENLQTMAALPALPNAAAVFGPGKDAPSRAEVPWIHNAPHLLYWGDLDTHGMHILGLVRKVLPQTESILMDEATLERFLAMAVIEPKPFTGTIGHLTEPELQTLALLRKNNTRLEQERINMPYAREVIMQRLGRGQTQVIARKP